MPIDAATPFPGARPRPGSAESFRLLTARLKAVAFGRSMPRPKPLLCLPAPSSLPGVAQGTGLVEAATAA